jgi:hypothetical protein
MITLNKRSIQNELASDTHTGRHCSGNMVKEEQDSE